MGKPGRPRKALSKRKIAEVRIPVTVQQKAIILDAADAADLAIATWARDILLRAARDQPTANGMSQSESTAHDVSHMLKEPIEVEMH